MSIEQDGYAIFSPAVTAQSAPVPPSDFKTQLVKSTFYFTYVFLLTTATITFIEAMRTKDPTIRHIMNLETCISVVAAFFYAQFAQKIQDAESKGQPIPYGDITITRYTDWIMTTPLMLLVLCTVLAYEKKSPLMFTTYAAVVGLNFLMLVIGYLGETNKVNRIAACFIGFLFFALMFGYMWFTFLGKGKKTFGALLSFFLFFSVWSIYGIAYLADEEKKNIAYNVLDLIAKAMIGIFFWMYFANVVVF